MTDEEKKRFDKIESDMSDMRKHSYAIEKKVDTVLLLLQGDDKLHISGLADQVQDVRADSKQLKDRVKKLENFKDRTIWTGMGLSITGGVGVWEFVKRIFSS